LRADWDASRAPAVATNGLAAVFTPDPSVWDGRFANNGWLQELPKPLSKEVWGAAVSIAPETAAAQGLSTGDLIELRHGDRLLRAPLRIAPGQAPDTLGLPLGYGRTAAGGIGSGVGVDVGALRGSATPWTLADVTLRRVGEAARVLTTQHHHAMEGRDIVRVIEAGAPSPEPPPQPSLHDAFAYDGAAWGMTIDLDACIGCNACVVACQAENNIAIVGPDEVAMGREMHWLRIDRYYEGEPASPQTYFQPVPCMQCEKAPCEIVCPVNATVHSSEGLNDMVYNRCVGTRTCSNNCPYKVRRFNWHDATRGDYRQNPESANPAVAVRARGVMEKCTYCVQRISAARMTAGQDDRAIEDGEVVTACQQSCPTRAIAFGDINEAGSVVARQKKDPRHYALLGELNTRPRTTYLARLAASPLRTEPEP
jgi:molybdopterin-containing oxidoreductase family iron-sulfur binding subunit